MKMKNLLVLALVIIMALICTACANASADADVSVQKPELKYGRYYLNGDKESGLYVDLDENFIVMGGENLRKHQEDFCRQYAGDTYSNEEQLQDNVDEIMLAYGSKSEYNYAVVKVGNDYHNYIFFDYFHDGTFDKNNECGSAYEYLQVGMITNGNDNFYLA